MTKPLSPVKSPPASETATPTTPRGGGGLTNSTPEGEGCALSSPAGILVSEGFDLCESTLASALGVPERALANLRAKKMVRGAEWELDGLTVMLTEKAAIALIAALLPKITPGELDLALKKCGKKAAFTARVARLPANPKMLTVKWTEGCLERTANIITNRRDNFRVGMEVPIRLNSETQRYELARPAPRQKGRW